MIAEIQDKPKICKYCKSDKITTSEKTEKNKIKYRCKNCKRKFVYNATYPKFWYPSEVIMSVIDLKIDGYSQPKIIEIIKKVYNIVISERSVTRWWKERDRMRKLEKRYT